MSIVEKELKHNPNAFGYFNLGVQYRAVGQFEKAIEAFQKIISSQSKYYVCTEVTNISNSKFIQFRKVCRSTKSCEGRNASISELHGSML